MVFRRLFLEDRFWRIGFRELHKWVLKDGFIREGNRKKVLIVGWFV
jgi:hypothetical protein